MTAPSRGRFRSLRNANYRIWAGGALVSNIGTWMQRIAQDWLVLTQLTAHNATAVGVVMALQYGPHLVLLPFTGYAADLFDRRRLLLATQLGMGALAAGLGFLTITGAIQLWEVYVMALVQGCITAFDAPARHSFVSELVGEADLSNAVALNSTSFNAARMIGPAAAGLIIAAVGCGWAFLINAASFVAVLGSLTLLRVDDLHRSARATRTRGGLVDGFRYVWRRDDLKTILVMLFLVGTFGMNFPIFISTMSVSVFHAGAGQYGLLMSIMAIGTIAGALLAAGQERPRFVRLVGGAAFFGLGCALAAVMPGYWLFGGTLVVIGVSALTFSNSTNSLMQLATEPAMRGRVMAMRLAVALGGTPIGAPIVGWVADHFGPRWSLGVGAAAGLAAAIVGLFHIVRRRGEGRAAPPGSSSSKEANRAAHAAKETGSVLAAMPKDVQGQFRSDRYRAWIKRGR
jgi:MFS family permease